MPFPESYTPPGELLVVEGSALAWIASHGDNGVALLLPQFRGKPRLEAFLRVVLDMWQEIDDAAWQVLTGRWLDNAVGVQLDALGWIVDLPRLSWDDDTYRVLIRATILVLRSSGTWPNFFEVLETVGLTLSLTSVDEPGMAAMRIILGEPLDGDISAHDLFALLLRRMPGAGIRFVLEFPTTDVDHSFTFASEGEGEGFTFSDGTPMTFSDGTPMTFSDGDPAVVDADRGFESESGPVTGGLWADSEATTDLVFNSIFEESL